MDDESLDARNVPSRFQKKIPATEDYVLHGLVEKVGKKQNGL